MRFAVATLLVAAGCDGVLGLHVTRAADATIGTDAAFFDAPLPSCPPIGTAPRFTNHLVQSTARTLQSYSLSQDAGIAIGTSGLVMFEGPIDGTMTASAGIDVCSLTGGRAPSIAQITPEGDEVFVELEDCATGVTTLARYARIPAGGWSYESDVAIPLTNLDLIGSFTRAPNRHVVITREGAGVIDEYRADDQGNWIEVPGAPYSAAALGIQNLGFHALSLSPDGLRMLVPQGNLSFPTDYLDRPTIDSVFGQAVGLDNVPRGVAFTVMTEDCGRIYVDGLGSLFYDVEDTTPR